jgi:hypothetical protein
MATKADIDRLIKKLIFLKSKQKKIDNKRKFDEIIFQLYNLRSKK